VCDSILLRLGAVPTSLQLYFQQIRPIKQCDAEDGRFVGQLLLDLVNSKPKDLAHAIREFANCTAMLRDCGFAYIGDMLARMLSADVKGGPEDGTVTTAISSPPVPTTAPSGVALTHQDAAVGFELSSLTEKQAITIGSAFASSVNRICSVAVGLKRVIKAHGVLQAMKSEYAWFVPMLEVIMAHKAAGPRGSMFTNRLQSSIFPAASSDVSSHADVSDEESGFISVVRLGAHGPRSAYKPTAGY
jgi:hypothetical protein